jgi:uncharacterized membrane protein
MTSSIFLVLAFLLGCVCGLRSMTGPAVVCWGAHLGWLQLDGSKLGFLHNPISLIVFSLMALGELIADKLPFIPSRITAGPLVVRFLAGALCGAALGITAGAAWLPGTLLGGIGGVAGAFAGYHARRWLTVGNGVPDLPIALIEDVIAVGGGLLIVSRF